MHRVFILSFFVFWSVFACGQSPFGVKGGMNLSKVRIKNTHAWISQYNLVSDISPGYYIGAYHDILHSDRQSTHIGVVLQQQAGKLKEMTGDIDIRLLDIEVPLDFIYRMEAGAGHVVLGLGPYVAYNLNTTYTQGNVSERYRMEGDNFSARLDYGANALVGYRFSNGLLLRTGYRLSLKSYFLNKSASTTASGFSVGIGYEFSRW